MDELNKKIEYTEHQIRDLKHSQSFMKHESYSWLKYEIQIEGLYGLINGYKEAIELLNK